MKIRKLIISILSINLIIISFILILGFRYIMNQAEAQVIAVDINNRAETVELKQEDFVDISKYIPDIAVELRYATENNIINKVLYKNGNAYLRKGTADKLREANYEFKRLGYRIKIWDAYRPTDVQKVLWSRVGDSRYIANPKSGSNHNRGAAVDITLVDKNGREILMPTDFDGFSMLADKDYSDVEKERAENAMLLENVMLKYGFESIYTEWWHFDDKDWRNYSIIDMVVSENIKEVYNNIQGDNSNISKEVYIDSELNFFEKFKLGINNINIEKIKVDIEYEIVKLKGIFKNYDTSK